MTSARGRTARVLPWVAGALLAGLAALLVARSGEQGPQERSVVTAAASAAADSRDDAARTSAVAPGGASQGTLDDPRATVAPADALGAIDPQAAWRAQVARAVQPIAARRLGRPLTPVEEQQLLDALRTVGPAARALDRESLDPDDPASIARVRDDTARLVEADRTCRALLGIGVAELLRQLDPSRIEDQAQAD